MRPPCLSTARSRSSALPLAGALLLALLLVAPALSCPRGCSCGLDRKGRRTVGCHGGDGKDPMPLPSAADKVEVFEVAPPADRPNYYTIGPIFSGHRKLEELHIVRSNLPAIGMNSFYGLSNLQVLNLTHNNMSALLEHNFRGLKSLRDLFLSDNRIESVPSSAFHLVEDVRRISLARNRIRDLSSRIFFKLAHLQDLDLSYNPLGELSTEVFRDVPELRVLRCRGCGVPAVNKTLLEVLPELEVLDLGDNKLTSLTAEHLEPLRQLQELWLDGNQLTTLPSGMFRYNSLLQSLDLARNHIAKVEDEAFLNLPALRALDLGHNQLERLHASVVAPLALSLRTLVLAGNGVPVEDLARLLRGVVHLTALSLADMRLRAVPTGMLEPLHELRLLNVSGNLLTALHPAALHQLLKLDTLDASRNSFAGLDEQSLLRLDAVELVLLDGNHWSCDTCHLPPLLSRVARSDPASPLRRLRCVSPRSLAGEPLATLELAALKWCSGGTGLGLGAGPDSPRSLLSADSQLGVIAAAAAVALLILAGAALLAVVAYSKHHADYYYTHEDKLGPEREAIFENMGAVIDDRGACKKAPKRVTIATIDELTKDPELHGLTNGA